MTKPILLTLDGWVADGNHRLAKSWMQGRVTILVKRLTIEDMERAKDKNVIQGEKQ